MCGVGSCPPGCGGRCVVWVVVLLVVEEGVWCGYIHVYIRASQLSLRPTYVRTYGTSGFNYYSCMYLLSTDVGDIDPYDLLDPEDILSKIPKDFYDNLVSCVL